MDEMEILKARLGFQECRIKELEKENTTYLNKINVYDKLESELMNILYSDFSSGEMIDKCKELLK